MKNLTKNQHFLSQAEQRLNAINPAAKAKNQRIYSFDVLRGADCKLAEAKSVRIESNLSDIDLYSFSLLDDKERLNFESAFGKYESEVKVWVDNLISKVSNGSDDVSEEVQRIFLLKFLNTLRNPFAMRDLINLFSKYTNYFPTDIELKSIYFKIDSNNMPHADAVCTRYKVTKEQYVSWLKILYLILYVKDGDETNLLESIAKSFYENPLHHIQIFLCVYSKGQSVLLSDKGFSKFDPTGASINYEFNLCDRAHVAYAFTDISKALPEHPLHGNEQVLNLFKRQPKNINVRLILDNQEMLVAYNQRIVEQSYKSVYCKYKIGL
ncbi:TPA: DUF4238 domain-containing protein [Vibrio parahaemolyticus]|nr:DUF4238 domain-containing protein [Vibrio parahaemolyticus]